MMTPALVLIAVLAASLFGLTLGILIRGRNQDSQKKSEEFAACFQKEIAQLRQSLNDQLLDLSRSMTDQQGKNARFMLDSHKGYLESVEKVQHQLGSLQQAAVTMMDLGKDIASLQDILRSPKLRGGIGEFFLEEILRQILPVENYELQYGFPDGSKVDAVIKMGEGLIPVDAKFPLENFRRMLASSSADDKASRKLFISDVKKHIDAIAAKYIRPEDRTFEFALMYIPAENIYYETIIKHDQQTEGISEYALKKKVIPVSPNSFYAYLQAIARGLKGMRIERSALKILESLGQLDSDLKKIALEFEKLGSHLAHAQTAFERTSKGFDKLQVRISSFEDHRLESKLMTREEPVETESA